MRRRAFGASLAGATAALGVPPALLGRARPRVVIVGGGAGGASAARALAADDALDVTLIDDSDTYTSCFYSNLYLGGYRTLASITHDYAALVERFGITKVTARVTGIDTDARRVTLAGGRTLPYDRLIVAPGIELVYDGLPGLSETDAELAPHAWRGGAQAALLARRIDALANGDDVVIVAPPNPYRCPPGPYERASMIAHALKAKGHADSRITILDPKPSFSKQALFTEGWARHYPGTIEWITADMYGEIERVDAAAGTVHTGLGAFRGALLNPIPAQAAGRIAREAGLTDDSGWCPVEAGSMRSTLDDRAFVVGDASAAGAMPKSGFAANSQAKVAAAHVRADLLGVEAPVARYANVCWSLLGDADGVKVGAAYEPRDGGIVSTSSFVSALGESAEVRRRTYEESAGWYAAIVADMFGRG